MSLFLRDYLTVVWFGLAALLLGGLLLGVVGGWIVEPEQLLWWSGALRTAEAQRLGRGRREREVHDAPVLDEWGHLQRMTTTAAATRTAAAASTRLVSRGRGTYITISSCLMTVMVRPCRST